jgi:hypothetical protein
MMGGVDLYPFNEASHQAPMLTHMHLTNVICYSSGFHPDFSPNLLSLILDNASVRIIPRLTGVKNMVLVNSMFSVVGTTTDDDGDIEESIHTQKLDNLQELTITYRQYEPSIPRFKFPSLRVLTIVESYSSFFILHLEDLFQRQSAITTAEQGLLQARNADLAVGDRSTETPGYIGRALDQLILINIPVERLMSLRNTALLSSTRQIVLRYSDSGSFAPTYANTEILITTMRSFFDSCPEGTVINIFGQKRAELVKAARSSSHALIYMYD